MKMLENLSELPHDIKFRANTSKEPCEDADYVFYHKYLNFYTCFTKEIEKGKKNDILRGRKKK